MRSIPNSRKPRALLTAALFTLLTAPLAGEAPPADANVFEPDGDFLLVLDGRTEREAEIFSSELAVAYLVVADEIEAPLVITPRTQGVESADPASVVRQDDGTVKLLDGERGEISKFHLDGTKVVWTMTDGREAKLVERPWILGRQGARPLKANPAWARRARLYEPSESHLEILRSLDLKNIRVKTYFGSWCPHCKQIVPRILRVADELQGTGIRFEYYGLPRSFVTDPEAVRLKIESVPTMLILTDGKETARLDGTELTSPEVGLKSVLAADR